MLSIFGGFSAGLAIFSVGLATSSPFLGLRDFFEALEV